MKSNWDAKSIEYSKMIGGIMTSHGYSSPELGEPMADVLKRIYETMAAMQKDINILEEWCQGFMYNELDKECDELLTGTLPINPTSPNTALSQNIKHE